MLNFCKTHRAPFFAVAVGIAVALYSGSARSEAFQDLDVSVRGSGTPVLMIPGLNSAASVWDETCAQLQPSGVQCHVVQLPGFAAAPAATLADPQHFLDSMRDRLLAYVAAKKLRQPVVLGHSLGGVLALKMALQEPGSVGRLVIVDALPFLGGTRDASASAESVKPAAEAMRAAMLSPPSEAHQAQMKANFAGMTRSPERVQQLLQWAVASDRPTSAQAMYEVFSTDLRADLGRITQPTLVLGSWAAYAPYGSTLESTRQVFVQQYRQLPGVRIELSQQGYHFLMWDDAPWLVAQVKSFIAP